MVCLFGIVWFQKLSIPPPQKEFFLRPPPPPTSLEIPVKLHTFTQIFGPLRIPPPTHPRNFQSLLWGSMDIFWNYTLIIMDHNTFLGNCPPTPPLSQH